MNTFLKNLLITCIILCVIPNITNAQIGCTDRAACNYDEFAWIDDGSCDYGNPLCYDRCDELTCPIIVDLPEVITIPFIPELEPDWCPWCPVCLTCPPFEIEHVVNPAIDPFINSGIGNPRLGSAESNTISTNSVKVFPNPTNGKFTITLDQDLSVPHTLTVFYLSGKVLQQITFTGKQANLDLSNAAKGIYMVKIQNDQIINILSTHKLLIR